MRVWFLLTVLIALIAIASSASALAYYYGAYTPAVQRVTYHYYSYPAYSYYTPTYYAPTVYYTPPVYSPPVYYTPTYYAPTYYYPTYTYRPYYPTRTYYPRYSGYYDYPSYFVNRCNPEGISDKTLRKKVRDVISKDNDWEDYLLPWKAAKSNKHKTDRLASLYDEYCI